ncbi:coiled-coil domain-containing protein 91 isoform X2 [Ambystoma mexicanum]|uniref:coiled-coil domain-containing protein 91 isoform X2 n=1 Tax=Ambystoma mexicanum TaxID=8296 RepID=UPI0037E91D71
MDLKDSLLKSIWYAFAALDLEKNGKVSKSQLKVLSHNLHTVLNIPIDPKILEDHFRDDETSPVSSQGYMVYLNSYILDKVREGSFERKKVDELCWMLTAKKYCPKPGCQVIPETDAFRLWCLFNFLSDDTYPLILDPEEVAYLLKKLIEASGLEWHQGDLDDYLSQKNPSLCNGLSVWQFLEMMESETFFPCSYRGALSLAIDHVYQEIYLGMIKKGYLWKKGLSRRNWNERWFVLKPPHLSYYTGEDLKDKKGEMLLSLDCVTVVLPDKENRRCLFCIKTPERTYEMSASDMRQRQEWMLAIQAAIKLQVENKPSLHGDLKLKRRQQHEQNRKKTQEKERELQRLQEERENYIKAIAQVQEQMEELMDKKNQQTFEQQKKLHLALENQLKQAKMAQISMQSEMTKKEEVAEQQRKKILELEALTQHIEMALQAEIQARLEEEKVRVAQARLLDEEEQKLNNLKCLKEEQDRLIQKTQEEKNELQQEMLAKSQALEQARHELNVLQASREQNHQNLEEAQKKLHQASQQVNNWNIQLTRLMQPIPLGGDDQKTS